MGGGSKRCVLHLRPRVSEGRHLSELTPSVPSFPAHMGSATPEAILGFSWEQQRRRAEDLAARYAFAQDALEFFRHLTAFQEAMVQGVSLGVDTPRDAGEPFPLRALYTAEHHDLLLVKFPAFLDLIRQLAPTALAEAADTLRSVPAERWEALLDAYWFQDPGQPDPSVEAGAMDFFPKAFLQPYAVALASGLRVIGGEAEIDWKVAQGIGVCPLCGARAQVSVLRPESHGASRSLLCSLCGTEWRFKRVRCVSCGEEEFTRLLYHTTEQFPHVRLNLCETCQTYIKEVDLSKEASAVPVVDEIATIPLDIVATARGCHKLELNLIGM